MSGNVGTRRSGAFTLIELLVVMAILGMLIGLLMPSLKRAREQARSTQCQSRLRGIYVGYTAYIHDDGVFPAMNNDPDDGAWQYNYLIYDGRDFEENFGPLINLGEIDNIEELYCPVQTDPFHALATNKNPWPVLPGWDTNAGYGRRYHLTGKSFSQIRRISAFVADALHLPKLIKSAHKTGVNVVYSDGHVR